MAHVPPTQVKRARSVRPTNAVGKRSVLVPRPESPPSEPVGEPALRGAYRAALAAISFGLVIGLAVVAAGAGLAWQERQGVGASGTAAAAASSGAPPRLVVQAKHIGDLKVSVNARLAVEGQPVRDAELTVRTDMKQMPGAHTGGPYTLRATREAGAYAGTFAVPMVGDWELEVAMAGSPTTRRTLVVPVGVVP